MANTTTNPDHSLVEDWNELQRVRAERDALPSDLPEAEVEPYHQRAEALEERIAATRAKTAAGRRVKALELSRALRDGALAEMWADSILADAQAEEPGDPELAAATSTGLAVTLRKAEDYAENGAAELAVMWVREAIATVASWSAPAFAVAG